MTSQNQHHHIYGLWRTSALRKIPIKDVNWWPDTPIMMAAVTLGEVIYVPGAEFHYQHNSRPFFNWTKHSSKTSALQHLISFGRRIEDLCSLILVSWRTVTEVAGPLVGAMAAAFAVVKILRQAIGFMVRRLIPINAKSGNE